MLRTRRLTFGRLGTVQKPGGVPAPRVTEAVIYTVPVGHRAIVREVSFRAHSGEVGAYVLLYVSDGTRSIDVVLDFFRAVPGALVLPRDFVMEEGDRLTISSNLVALDYYISGAELVLR